MLACLLVAMVLLAAGPARAAIAPVQSSPLATGSGASITATYGSPTTSGNLLVATIVDANSGCFTTTFTAPAGWTRAATACRGAGGPVEIWYRANAPPGVTGVTFTTGNAAAAPVLQLSEWSGAATSGVVDATGTGSSGTASTAPSVTTSGAVARSGDLALTAFQTTTGLTGLTPGAGWTALRTSTTWGLLSDYRIDPPLGSAVTETIAAAPATPWTAAVAAFAPADTTAPTTPTVSGGSLTWQNAASVTVTGSGSTDVGGTGVSGYEYRTSVNGGSTWSGATAGASLTVSAAGETLVQFRALDAAGNAGAWTSAAAAGGTVRLDRTAPSAPTVLGGSLSWSTAASVSVGASGSTDSGGAALSGYEYRTSVDGGTTWSAQTAGANVTVSAEGMTLVQFRSLDTAGNASAWTPATATAGSTVKLDRTAPGSPTVSGGSLSWLNSASVTVTGSGATDAGAGGVTYAYRTSTDGGTTWGAPTSAASVVVSAAGETLVQFRAADALGNTTAWTPAPVAAGSTVRLDRTAPSAPAVSGGSLSWQAVASVTVTGSGATDTGGAGLSGYEYRTSTDGGTTWSPGTAGTSAAVAAEGTTLVQFRSLDTAGNASAWTPATATAGSTVKLDRTAPTDPTVGGGSLTWFSAASTVFTASASTDATSGIARYEYRTSADSGVTWTAATTGASTTVTAEGEYVAQFRSVDNAGNVSSWVPVPVVAAGTSRLDRTPPTDPGATCGSLSWQNVVSQKVKATSSNGGPSGINRYEYRTSTDGGGSWSGPTVGSSPVVSASGETLVQFRAVDGAGNLSQWAPAAGTAAATVRIARSGPTAPTSSGGSAAWRSVPSVTVTGSGATVSPGFVAGYEYRTSTDSGCTWGGANPGASAVISAEGLTMVQFRGVDNSSNPGTWAPAAGTATATVMIDRTAPTQATASGGSSAWQSVPSITITGSGASDALSGVAGYEYRTSTNGGSSWSAPTSGTSVTLAAEGETLVQFRAVDNATNAGAWSPSAVARIDRTPGTLPTVSGGSGTWLSQASLAVGAAGSTDALSGIAGYEYRTSTDGGSTWSGPASGASLAVTAEGETLLQFRSVDNAGNGSAWEPAGPTNAARVRLDRTAPTAATASGGSLGWQNVASITVTGSGADGGPSGVAGYEYRTSTNGGSTWSAPAAGTGVTGSAEGETLVQFRATDGAGNVAAWAPAAGTGGATMRIDRTNPTDPTTVSGGSLSWQSVPSVTVTPSGSTDAVSGVATYAYRTSTDGGTTWSGASPANAAVISAEGQTLVQFQAIDQAGNASAWVPASATAGATVRINRTGPSAPTVTGGSLSWQNTVSVTMSAAGSTTPYGSLTGYEYRTSTDGGTTWTVPAAGSSYVASAEGQTLAQFRAVDDAGNRSAWTPAVLTAGGTARIDRTYPTAPSVAGGSATWQAVASTTLSASGSTDAVSGLTGYEYRTSGDGGTTWSGATAGSSLTVTSEGETLVQFRALDAAGNAGAWSTAGIARIDRTAPGAPIVSGGSSAWQNPPSVTVTGSGAVDTGGSSVAGYEYRTSTDAGTTWSAATAGASVVVSAEGETLVQFRAVDGVGTTGPWSTVAGSSTVRLDRASPTVPTVSGGSMSWSNAASVTVTASGGADALSGFSGYEYRTSTDGGGTWSAATPGASSAVSGEGETQIQFRSVDAAGNRSAWSVVGASSTVRLNRTGPSAPTVSGGSASWQNTASVTVTGSGSTTPGGSVTGYQYRTSTDGGSTWSAPAAGAGVTASAEGETLVQFRALDDSGNTGPWSAVAASGTVRLDRSAPTAPTASGGNAAWQNVASVTVTATGGSDAASGIASYQHRTSTDGGTTWSAATAGGSVVVGAEGTTLVQVRAVDGVGLTSAWSASGTVTLDRTAPTVPSVSGGSASWLNQASTTVTGAGSSDALSGISGYEYRTSTDAGTTWSAPAAGATATVSAEGETLVQLRAVDTAGNASAWSAVGASGTVRLDRTAPSAATVLGGSLSWQSAASVSVGGSGSTDAGGSALTGYQYRTSADGGTTWSAATAGANVTVSAEGTTLVQFRGVDGAGNAGTWAPASATAGSTVKLDRTAPGAPAVGGGSLLWQPVASVTMTASGGTDSLSGVTGYEYRTSTDGGSTWSVPAPGAGVTASAEGETRAQFRSVDGAGNRSGWADGGGTLMARIDRTAPGAASVTGGSAAWQSVGGVSVSASGATDAGGAGLASYEYRTTADGGTTWSAPAAGASVTVTAQGETAVQFRALDAAGNAGSWGPATGTPAATVRIDRTAPALPAVSGGSASWLSLPSATLAATASGDTGGSGVAGLEYRTSADGGVTWSTAAAGASVTVTAEGETRAQFRSVDGAGNRSGWEDGAGTLMARLDRSVPSVPGVSGGSLAWTNAASVTVTGSGSTDGVSGVVGYEHRTSTDGGTTWTAPAAGAAVAVTAEGETLTQFRAVDAAGNVSSWSGAGASSTVRINRTGPTAPTVSGGSASWQDTASVTVTAAGSTTPGGSVTGYEHRASTDGGATWSAPAAGSSVVVSAEGETLVQFRASDDSGNTGSWSASGAGGTVRLDRSAPTGPTVTGGTGWVAQASAAVSASGGTDSLSGVTGYEHRTSTDGGATWSAPAAGAAVTVTGEGQTLVQFRTLDAVGLSSAWSSSATVRLDRTAPSAPVASGGSLAWLSQASATVTGAGGTDAVSGVTGYEYRTSTDGGATWSAAAAGASVTVTEQGETVVQFRSVDAAGNTSAWAPVPQTAGGTVRLDRTAPGAGPGAELVAGGDAEAPVIGVGPLDGVAPTSFGAWNLVAGSATGLGTGWQAGQGVQSITLNGSTGPGTFTQTLATTPGAVYRVSLLLAGDPGGGAAVMTLRIGWDGAALRTVRFDTSGHSPAAMGWTPVVLEARATSSTTALVLQSLTPGTRGPAADAISVRPVGGPVVAGGSLSWQQAASVSVTASGAGDAFSGVAGYEYATSTDAGVSWSAPAAGASVSVTAEGETLVRFRAVDAAGNTGEWSAPGAGGTVRLDRSAPSAPGVSGGALGWLHQASTTVTASGGADGVSGVAGYEHRTSTDGGATWSAPAAGPSVTVTAEGETLVEFRAVDAAGNASTWSAVGASSTVRLDRGDPSVPGVSGGGLGWLSQASATVTASGAFDAVSGVAGYEHRTSTDGGATWSAPSAGPSATVTAEGETQVQARSLDAAGNASAWSAVAAAGTVRLDRTPPSAPTGSGGSLAWLNRASTTLTGSGSADATSAVSGYEHRTSTDGGATWSAPSAGPSVTVTAEGETLVQFRGVDAAGNASAWSAIDAGTTVRLDRSDPSVPTVAGGSLNWLSTASVSVGASAGTDGLSGVAGYESRVSADGGATWSAPAAGASTTVTAEGETLVEFRTVDGAGNAGAWSAPGAGSTVRIDRTAPSDPAVAGGGNAWQNPVSVTVTGSGSTDALAGVAAYEYRTSADGGTTWGAGHPGAAVTVTDEGETLVQFRSVDGAGNMSGWAPATATAGSTVRLNRSGPTRPTVTGGGAAWQAVAAVTVTASGSTTPGGSVTGYEHAVSTDGGATWSAPAAGASIAITAEGESLVRFRALDDAGNTGSWSTPGASATARIDRSDPTVPIAAGGAAAWLSQASVTITGSGSADAVSAVAGYEHQTSADAGLTWSAPAAGASVTVSAEGDTRVRMRSVDAAGNASGWSAPETVRLDRTAPTDPVVTGGSLTWMGVPQVTVRAAGASGGDSGLAGYAHRVSADGGTTWGAATSGASVTVTAGGETLVQFRSADGAGNTSPWTPAHATGPDPEGTVRLAPLGLGAPRRVSVTGADGDPNSDALWADAARDTLTNQYLVVWTADTGAAHEQEVWARLISGAGAAAGDPFRVSHMGPDGNAAFVAWEPRVVYNATDHEYAVTWYGDDAVDNEFEVYAQRVGPTGALLGPQVRVSHMGPDGNPAYDAWHPRIAWDSAADRYLVAWDGDDNTGGLVNDENEIFAQRLSPGLAAVGSRMRISHMGPDGNAAFDALRPDVADDPLTDGVLVVWQGDDDTGTLVDNESEIFARRVDGTGPAGATVRVSHMGPDGSTATGAATPAVAADGASGDYLVTWSGDDASAGMAVGEREIWAQRLTGAAALTGGVVRVSHMGPDGAADHAALAPAVSWNAGADQYLVAWTGNDAGDDIEVFAQRLLADGSEYGPDDVRVSHMGPDGDPAYPAERVAVAGGDGSPGWLLAWNASDNTGGLVAGENEIHTRLYAVDSTPPTVPAVAGGSAAWSSAASATVTASGADDPESGIAGYQRRVSTDGGATWTAPAAGASLTVTAEGETLVAYRAVNGIGGQSAWVTATVRLDRTAPGDPSAAGGSAAWGNAATVTVSGTGAGGGPSGDTWQHRTSTDAGATWTAPAAGRAVTVTAEGETLVQFRVTDGAGNASAWGPPAGTDAATVRLDRTAPAVPAVGGGATAWRDVPSVTVTATGSTDAGSGMAGYEHATSIDGGATWSAPASGAGVTVTAEGETLVRVRAVDAAGNASAWAPAPGSPAGTVRIDRGPPAAPAGVTAPAAVAGPPTLSWPAGDDVTAYRVLRDGVVVGTTTGLTFTDTALPGDGTYVYRVIALDGAGNESPPSAPLTVTLDTVAPPAPSVPGITGGSAAWSTAASVTVTGTAPSGAALQHRTSTDGGATWTAPAAGATVTATAEGETLVQFRSTDAAGNASAWVPPAGTAAATVRLDRTPPATPSGVGGAGTVTTQPVITWRTAADAVAYRVTRDGTAVGTVTGTAFTDSALGVGGSYSYRVVAVDRAGGTSAPSAAVVVVYAPSDVIPPDTRITAAPSGPTATATPAIGFAATEPATFACRLDAGAWTPCTSPFTPGPLADGPHTVEIRATDMAANTDQTPASVAFTVDTVAPPAPALTATALNTPPLNSGRGAVALTTGLGGDAVRVVVTEGSRTVVDGAPGTVTDTGPTDGVTVIYTAVAVDAAGNISAPVTATATTPDRTPPARPGAVTADGRPTAVGWAAVPDAVAYRLLRDGAVIATTGALMHVDPAATDTTAPPVPSGLSATVGADGVAVVRWAAVTDQGTTRTYALVALDAAGNASPESPPTAVTTTAGLAGYRLVVDGVPGTRVAGTSAALTGLAAGSTHTIAILADDAEGNASAPSAPVTIRVPVTPQSAPGLAVSADRAAVRPGDAVRLTATATGASADAVVWTPDADVTLTGASVTHTFATPGLKTVTARLTGAGGTATATVQVLVDATPPVLDVRAAGAALAVVARDGESGVRSVDFARDGGAFSPVPADGIALAEGVNHLLIRVVDNAGNVRQLTRDVVRDTTAPVLRVVAPVAVTGPTAVVRVIAADSGSGLATLTAAGRTLPAVPTTLRVPSGSAVTVAVADAAGNSVRARVAVARLRDAPPGATLPVGAALTPDRRRLLLVTQAQLRILGVLTARPAARVTPAFTAALTRYQRTRRLPAAGAVTAATRRALARDVARRTRTVLGA